MLEVGDNPVAPEGSRGTSRRWRGFVLWARRIWVQIPDLKLMLAV